MGQLLRRSLRVLVNSDLLKLYRNLRKFTEKRYLNLLVHLYFGGDVFIELSNGGLNDFILKKIYQKKCHEEQYQHAEACIKDNFF